MKYDLKAGLFKVDSDMMEGQTIDFLCVIAELRKQQKAEDGVAEDGEGGIGDDDLTKGESNGVDADKDSKRMKRVLHSTKLVNNK